MKNSYYITILIRYPELCLQIERIFDLFHLTLYIYYSTETYANTFIPQYSQN